MKKVQSIVFFFSSRRRHTRWNCDWSSDVCSSDLEKARALLKEAGHANGFELAFLVPESGSGMQSPVEMATVIQANLAQIGVRAKIQTMAWGAYLRKYLEQPDMAEMSWNPSIGDPDHMMYMLLSSDRF